MTENSQPNQGGRDRNFASTTFGQTLHRFFDGAISGCVAGAALQPLQVIKTSMQVSPIDKLEQQEKMDTNFGRMLKSSSHKHYRLLTFREATKLIYQREGIGGYYRGFLPSTLKNSLNAGTYFSSLHYFILFFQKTGLLSEHANNSISSALARTLQSTLCNPLVVIKTRLEVLGFQEYNGTTDAIIKIARNEGLGGFFTGLKVSLIRDVPFSGVYYPIYQHTKNFTARLAGLDNKEGKFESEAEGARRTMEIVLVSSTAVLVANFVSCMITHPLDIIRTRIYFQHFNKDTTQHYGSIFQAVKSIHEHDGMIGYFRGITPRIMRKGAGGLLTWGLYEYLVDKRTINIKFE